MFKQRHIDIAVGLFMIIAIISVMIIAIKMSGFTTTINKNSFYVTADFVDIGNLKIHAPVTIAGVKIGEITNINLRPDTLNATVTMVLNNNKIPYSDSSARILTQGLLGSNYVSIVAGFDDNPKHPYLRNGDIIEKTQEALILENVIGQLLFNIKK